MNAGTLAHLAECAGPDLLFVTRRPFVVGSGEPPEGISAAVYVVENRDGVVIYVGQVRRLPGSNAVAERIREHLAEPHKAAEFDRVHVVALRPESSRSRVNQVESVLAHELKPKYGIHPSGWDR
jgi:hypothetical protein